MADDSSEEVALTDDVRIVCLGASAGGLEALEEFFEALPDGTGCAFVVIVHLSPDHKSLMPDLLSRRTKMPVAAIDDGVEPQPDHVYVIPSGKNIEIEGQSIRLVAQERGPGAPLNLPIDIFLDAIAEDFGESNIAIILSGSGSDGSRGIRAIKESGGLILVQDPETAKFDGMPRSALQTGLADYMGSPRDLADRVMRISSAPEQPIAQALDDEATREELVKDVLALIRSRHGSDHSSYRSRVVVRRITRRMVLLGMTDLSEYLTLLHDDPDELASLRADLLIGVTAFFRDPVAYDALKHKAIPKLLEGANFEHPLRIWIPACSTGQEVYSLVMVLLDCMERMNKQVPLKVFATDVNEVALTRAARGVYTISEVADVPKRYVPKYLEQRGQEYVVSRQLREPVIFAKHDVIMDPPFTRIDLVSCRNLLIYLQPDAQRRVLSSLHYALRPDTGLMFLGIAEVATSLEGVVESLDDRARLYRRSGQAQFTGHMPPARDPVSEPRRTVRHQVPKDRLRDAMRALLYADRKTAALVSPSGRLIELIADPGGFFRLSEGAPTTDVSQLLPPDIVTAFSAAQARLMHNQEPVGYSARGVGQEQVEVRVMAAGNSGGRDGLLVLEITRHKEEQPEALMTIDEQSASRISALEREIRTTRETLQATIEELQSTNEEQQSTNEELIAANEELQSTNEELHSVNEELVTVNAEYQRKNRQLQTTTEDLDNLLSSIEVGTLFLDENLRIRRFTQRLNRVVQLVEHDTGRRITEFSHHLTHDFVDDVTEVLETGIPISREVRDLEGAWLLMNATPYRGQGNSLKGVLVTFVEVTRLKNAEQTALVVLSSMERLNEELRDQADQLEDMFSIVAHDLKRPLLAINGMLALTFEALDSGEVDTARERVQKVEAAATELRQMLADLSSISQESRADLYSEEIDLRDWFNALTAPFAARAKEAGIEFNRVCDNGSFSFVRPAAETSIKNLVENALVHGSTAKAPHVDVSCRVAGEELVLVVSDNGKGIRKEEQALVWELFRRLDSNMSSGTGVGLVSVRRLVQRSGGTVDIESTEDAGARFEVRLPLHHGSADGPKVLLVEDDDVDAGAIVQHLAVAEVVRAKSIASAIDLLPSHHFDAALLDISLPDGHGLSLIEPLRASGFRGPTFILTGHPGGLNDDALRQVNVDGIIDKATIGTSQFPTGVVAAIHNNEPG